LRDDPNRARIRGRAREVSFDDAIRYELERRQMSDRDFGSHLLESDFYKRPSGVQYFLKLGVARFVFLAKSEPHISRRRNWTYVRPKIHLHADRPQVIAVDPTTKR
jgi:hypothetical protein